MIHHTQHQDDLNTSDGPMELAVVDAVIDGLIDSVRRTVKAAQDGTSRADIIIPHNSLPSVQDFISGKLIQTINFQDASYDDDRGRTTVCEEPRLGYSKIVVDVTEADSVPLRFKDFIGDDRFEMQIIVELLYEEKVNGRNLATYSVGQA